MKALTGISGILLKNDVLNSEMKIDVEIAHKGHFRMETIYSDKSIHFPFVSGSRSDGLS